MRNAQHIGHDVQLLIQQTQLEVAKRLHELFQSLPMIQALGRERALRLADHTADGAERLGWVSNEVREAIVERRPENPLRMFGLWHVVDAVGFLQDCAPGRWPYFTDDKRRQSLAWAVQELDELSDAVAEVQRREAVTALVA